MNPSEIRASVSMLEIMLERAETLPCLVGDIEHSDLVESLIDEIKYPNQTTQTVTIREVAAALNWLMQRASNPRVDEILQHEVQGMNIINA